ncbi:MAG: DUF5814 domain-containing protein [Halobacteriaceae archaeon]
MAITDKIYVKNHHQINSQLDTTISKNAFSGQTLDRLFQGDNLANLDSTTRERVLDFAEDFLDCNCDANPYCGHPERKFIRYILTLRSRGLSPESIVDRMTEDYMVYAYPGDILTFLDDSVRTLEAIESLAEVEANDSVLNKTKERKQDLLN